MKIYPAEWLNFDSEERLLLIRLTVSENLQKQRKEALERRQAKQGPLSR